MEDRGKQLQKRRFGKHPLTGKQWASTRGDEGPPGGQGVVTGVPKRVRSPGERIQGREQGRSFQRGRPSVALTSELKTIHLGPARGLGNPLTCSKEHLYSFTRPTFTNCPLWPGGDQPASCGW